MAEKNPARTVRFKVTVAILGLGGHSSTPYKTHNPLIAATELIHVITQRIWYEFSAFDNVSLLPESFDSGTKINIIPETASFVLHGEYVDIEQLKKIKEIVTTSSDAIKALYKVEPSITFKEVAA